MKKLCDYRIFPFFFSILSYANEKLRVGLFHIVPYAYIEEGKLTGISYDIIQKSRTRIEYKTGSKITAL